jgi:hypothetical protein
MSGQPEISQWVTAVLRAWQQAKINSLVLRNYESLPRLTANDIDALVDPAQLRQAEQGLLGAESTARFWTSWRKGPADAGTAEAE